MSVENSGQNMRLPTESCAIMFILGQVRSFNIAQVRSAVQTLIGTWYLAVDITW